jgi:dolichol-phosphate mannosyltransferase
MDLSVVVPVRNEEGNVRALVEEICSALDGRLEYEILFVDDGSRDGTAGQLAEAMATTSALRVLRHAEPAGQSAAIVTGVRAATGAWIATLDGDGQNDPADIPRLYEIAVRPDGPPNLQCVAGWRRKRQDTRLKRFSAYVANSVRSRLLSDDTPDTGCGLKLIPRGVLMQLPVFDHMHRFLPALIRRNGGVSISVEVSHRPRIHGRSHYGVLDRLWVGIVDMIGVMWLSRRAQRPRVEEIRRS